MTDEPKNTEKAELQAAAEMAVEEGAAEVAEGLETLELAADMAAVSAAELAAGASDLTRATDLEIVADRVAGLSEVVAAAL